MISGRSVLTSCLTLPPAAFLHAFFRAVSSSSLMPNLSNLSINGSSPCFSLNSISSRYMGITL